MVMGVLGVAALLTPLPDINHLAKMPEYLSSPLSQVETAENTDGSLSVRQAMDFIASSRMATSYLKGLFQEGCALLDAIEEGNIEKGTDIAEIIKQYETSAKLITGQLTLLKLAYTLAESSDAWKPHVPLLRSHASEVLRVLANSRNILLRIATVLKQYLPPEQQIPSAYIPCASEAAFREAVEISHKKFGLAPPEWK
ncbi:hypothetical protein VY487_004863 [Salmonella enterica]|nr:hypothetical protein [Salmonella enterica]ECC1244013.1 hypothetical protein [Salmonella enterica subsp. enterica serovar Poona]ECD6955815.1 hypothetical protein [Salmonella enterica subsp. enterica serovar Poona]ECF3857990.1 hypothetical protein [Salmonella enterica subsp. enterica serovar Poona]EDG7553826.1 hypothetical protein [Salmonella enterica subsp. enterica serovar Poona]